MAQSFSRNYPLSLELELDLEPLRKAIEQYGDRAKDHFMQGMQQQAEATMALAKAVYVPVVSGNLRSSGFVGSWIPSVDGAYMDIAFGGASAPYAAAIHGAPASRGQHKNFFLTRALMQTSTTAEAQLALWMQRMR